MDAAPPPLSPTGEAGAVPSAAHWVFAPSGLKLALLCFTTWGIYAMYWFYRNWLAIRHIERRPGIMAAWRAALMPLWAYSCFRQLGRITGQPAWRIGCGSVLLALACLGLSSSWFISPPVPSLPHLLFLPILPVNAWLRRFKRQHGVAASARERFSVWNWLWIAMIGLLQLLAITYVVLIFALR